MDLYKYLKLPIKEKLLFCNKIKTKQVKNDTDLAIINDIHIKFTKTCERLKINLVNLLNEEKLDLPENIKSHYQHTERMMYDNLPFNKWNESHHKFSKLIQRIHEESKVKKQIEFDKSKLSWCEKYPDFKKITEIMGKFKTNALLSEYLKKSRPDFIHKEVITIYKKCLSHKVKLKTNKLDKLGYSYTPSPFCIDDKIVKKFINEYIEWGRKSYYLWDDSYYLNQDFFDNVGYKYDWEFDVKYGMLNYTLEKVEHIYKETMKLIDSGINMINNYKKKIDYEYLNNSFEMSYFEREIEISQLKYEDNLSDEEYCYVYTLKCDLFVFYVGIASNPSERLEQHIRGAYGNESHLFKSKFIQKYHQEMKQDIVFEGTRRECKLFEIEYIKEFNPLGNMTAGGEG